MKTETKKETLSALLDGELEGRELEGLLAELGKENDLQQDWEDWCLLSDAMRHSELSGSQDFMARFSDRLAQEPVLLVPRAPLRKSLQVRRILVPLTVAASVAFVGVAAWRVSHSVQEPVSVEQYANGAAPASSDLRPYLAAHQESGGNVFPEREVIQVNFEQTEVH